MTLEMYRECGSPDDVIAWATKHCAKVKIHKNKQAGEVLYAIDLNIDPGYWVEAFETKKEALDFCKEHNLTVTTYCEDEDTRDDRFD